MIERIIDIIFLHHNSLSSTKCDTLTVHPKTQTGGGRVAINNHAITQYHKFPPPHLLPLLLQSLTYEPMS